MFTSIVLLVLLAVAHLCFFALGDDPPLEFVRARSSQIVGQALLEQAEMSDEDMSDEDEPSRDPDHDHFSPHALHESDMSCEDLADDDDDSDEAQPQETPSSSSTDAWATPSLTSAATAPSSSSTDAVPTPALTSAATTPSLSSSSTDAAATPSLTSSSAGTLFSEWLDRGAFELFDRVQSLRSRLALLAQRLAVRFETEGSTRFLVTNWMSASWEAIQLEMLFIQHCAQVPPEHSHDPHSDRCQTRNMIIAEALRAVIDMQDNTLDRFQNMMLTHFGERFAITNFLQTHPFFDQGKKG